MGARIKAIAGWAAARTRKTSPSPLLPPWEAPAARYGVGIHHNVAVPMSDGISLRVDIHYPTDPATGEPATGPFPVLLSMTPYGKKAPPPAAQIGGGATPYLIRRGYIEVMADVRGTGVSGGSFEMLGPEQVQDGVDLVNWAASLPNSNGRVGMFGISYLAINQLLTASAVGPDSPLKAIFPAMAANDFYRDVVTMGGVPHMRTVRAYGATYSLLNVINPALEFAHRGGHERPRAGGISAVRQRGRDQRNYFKNLIKDAIAGGDTAFDGTFWDTMRPADVIPKIVENGVAVFLVAGWHDAFQRGAPLNYAALQNTFAGRPAGAAMTADQPVSDRFQLMAGPWYHVSDLDGQHLQALQLRWFDHWLKGDDTAAVTGQPVRFQAIGSPKWFRTNAYPFPEATPTRLYLGLGGGLHPTPSAEESTATLQYLSRAGFRAQPRTVEPRYGQFHGLADGPQRPVRPGQQPAAARCPDLHQRGLRHREAAGRAGRSHDLCHRRPPRHPVGGPPGRSVARRRQPAADRRGASRFASRSRPRGKLDLVRRHRATAPTHQHQVRRRTRRTR